MSHKAVLQRLYEAAIDAVGGEQACRRALESAMPSEPVWMAAVGKAAPAMARGAAKALGAQLEHGLVITKYGHLENDLRADSRLHCLESAHPTPDRASLEAGAELRRFVAAVPADARLLVLLSGGASALVEQLIEGVALADLQAVTERLLAGGYPIGRMNYVRRCLSRIKGGRLAGELGAGPVTQLVISDVPGDCLQDIGSGPLVPPGPAPDGHEELLANAVGTELLAHIEPPPSPENAIWQRIDTQIVASSTIACQAVAVAAEQAGLPVVRADGSLDDDVHEVVERIAATLLGGGARRGVYVWGGEPTMLLPDDPGRGGRNQHLALLLAKKLADAEARGVSILCCATDGTDGPTADAGGLVDANTLTRGLAAGADIERALARADAGSFLAASGDLVSTGPTGTNVMDLVIAWREGEQQ